MLPQSPNFNQGKSTPSLNGLTGRLFSPPPFLPLGWVWKKMMASLGLEPTGLDSVCARQVAKTPGKGRYVPTGAGNTPLPSQTTSEGLQGLQSSFPLPNAQARLGIQEDEPRKMGQMQGNTPPPPNPIPCLLAYPRRPQKCEMEGGAGQALLGPSVLRCPSQETCSTPWLECPTEGVLFHRVCGVLFL